MDFFRSIPKDESLLIEQVGEYSHVDRIIPIRNSSCPASVIFGSEPAHDWCYYYQKASLARQKGDWEEIGRLYDTVRKLELETDDKSEVIPFFEGLVNLGRLDDARALYTNQIKGNAKMRLPLCTFLSHRIQATHQNFITITRTFKPFCAKSKMSKE